MFPMTMTIHNAQQLEAVMHVLLATKIDEVKDKLGKSAKGTTLAATSAESPAPTQATAEAGVATDAPVKTAGASNPTAGSAAAEQQASTAVTEGDAVGFETVKKAFLALSTTPGGREKCQAVIAPLAKLSEAKPEQYAAILAKIKKAGE
jgi:hypothetical protein